MRNSNDGSYERYKRYRYNRYRYENEQIVFPTAIVVGGAIIIGLWKYILIAIIALCVLFVALVFLWTYLKKQLYSTHEVVLSREDARDGVLATIRVSYHDQKVMFTFDFPPNIQNGQRFMAKNVVFVNKKGKRIKKNIHFKVQVRESG